MPGVLTLRGGHPGWVNYGQAVMGDRWSEFDEPATVSRSLNVIPNDPRFPTGHGGFIGRYNEPAPSNPMRERAAMMQFGAELSAAQQDDQMMKEKLAQLQQLAPRFDERAKPTWDAFNAEMEKVKEWKFKTGAEFMEDLYARKQLFDRYISGFDWDTHVRKPGSMPGDVYDQGVFKMRKSLDPKGDPEIVGFSDAVLQDQSGGVLDELGRTMVRPIQHNGQIVGYMKFNPFSPREKVSIDWADPKKLMEEAEWITETAKGVQEQFMAENGRKATPVELKERLRSQLGAFGIGSKFFQVTDEDALRSVEEWGKYVQQFLSPGQQEVLKDPLQTAIFSYQVNGKLTRPITTKDSSGKDIEELDASGNPKRAPLIVPREVAAVIQKMLAQQSASMGPGASPQQGPPPVPRPPQPMPGVFGSEEMLRQPPGAGMPAGGIPGAGMPSPILPPSMQPLPQMPPQRPQQSLPPSLPGPTQAPPAAVLPPAAGQAQLPQPTPAAGGVPKPTWSYPGVPPRQPQQAPKVEMTPDQQFESAAAGVYQQFNAVPPQGRDIEWAKAFAEMMRANQHLMLDPRLRAIAKEASRILRNAEQPATR